MTTQPFYPSQQDFNGLESAEVITPKQRTVEWYEARRGRFTGSEVWKLMTEPRTKAAKDSGELSEKAKTYTNQVLAEVITGITPDISSASMQWGIEHEREAKEVYQSYFSEAIEDCDFISDGRYGGGSPDGFIGKDGIAEIKCPYNSGIHLENCAFAFGLPSAASFKEQYKEYYYQIQNNLKVTGRKFCRFISFDPRFKGTHRISCVTVERVEDDIKLIHEKVSAASVVMEEIKTRLGL